MLPDVALLEIFDLYLVHPDPMNNLYWKDRLTTWHSLVHVCRKWRNIVFGSPLRLNLRLYCEPRLTPVRERMAVWPSLPIAVSDDCDQIRDNEKWVDNIVAVFEHSDRICRLNLAQIRSWQLEKVLAGMQQPFPALTRLSLSSKLEGGETAPVDPDSFLGGSAPQLQTLVLVGILFPGLPKLLLSATQLVRLILGSIPHSGYISPEKMVACLSLLTKLEDLSIGFESPQSRPDRRSRHPLPLTRTVLPVLTWLSFHGVSEYLEDLVARIDAPLLHDLCITFFHQLIFDTPQLTQLIGRCAPKFKTLNIANLDFLDYIGTPNITLLSHEPHFDRLYLGVSCNKSDWCLSFMTQICSSSFTQDLLSMVETLCIEESGGRWNPPWHDDIDGGQWLEVLRPFTAVKVLYVFEEFAQGIAQALQELVGDRAMEVLPALQTLDLRNPMYPLPPSRPDQDAVDQFVAARKLAGHPIVVHRFEGEDVSGS